MTPSSFALSSGESLLWSASPRIALIPAKAFAFLSAPFSRPTIPSTVSVVDCGQASISYNLAARKRLIFKRKQRKRLRKS